MIFQNLLIKICLVLRVTKHFIYQGLIAYKLVAYGKIVTTVYYCKMPSKDLMFRVCFLQHLKIGNGYGKNITLAYF